MKSKLALSAVALMVAQTASAASLSLTYNSSAAGYGIVTIDASPVTPVSNPLYAGGFNMTDSTPGGLGNFLAWCLDIGAWLGAGGSYAYETTTNPFTNGGQVLDSNAQARVASVFNANFGASVTSNPDSSAAFQLALWESIYDTDMNISTGAFQASSSGSIETLASGFLSGAASYGSGANLWDLTFLQSSSDPRQQNLVTASASLPPAPTIPLPAGGLLLLTGIAGVAGLKRRKKRTA